MSSRPEDVVSRCHQLLEMRNFTGAQFLVRMNKLIRKDWHELDQAEAICDVIIAAENLLPNGSMDYYGMIRVTRLGPVVLDDFLRLMKLLDERYNRFPFSQEAAQLALQAWSLLSEPALKTDYDLSISAGERSVPNPETNVPVRGRGRGRGRGGNSRGRGRTSGRSDGGNDRSGITSGGRGRGRRGGFNGGGSGFDGSVGLIGEGDRNGGSSVEGYCHGGKVDGEGNDGNFDGVGKGKQKMEEEFMRISPLCNKVSIGNYATENAVPYTLPEKPYNHRVGLFPFEHPESTSLVHKEETPDNNVVVISDDDDGDDGEEKQETITMARAAKVCIVDGMRVKLIPSKKKTEDCSTSNVKKEEEDCVV